MTLKKNYFPYLYFFIIISLISGPAIPDILTTLISIVTIIYIIIHKHDLDLSFFYKFSIFYFLILFTTLFSNNISFSFLNFAVDARYFLYLFSFSIFFEEKYLEKFLIFLLFINIFLFLDLALQYNFGKDIFGFSPDLQSNKQRLNGPFDDEYIVGTYIYKITLPIVGYFIFKNQKAIYIPLITSSLIAIIFSGERMSLILFLFGIFLIFLFLKKFKELSIFIFSSILILIFLYSNFSQINFKFNEFIFALKDFKNTGHGAHFLAAFYIFLENPITGAGVKMFRVVCSEPSIIELVNSNAQACATHPHNLYLEIISETGLIGLFALFFFLFIFLLHIIKNDLYKNEYVGFVVLLVTIFWPISSNGNIFNNWNAILNFTLLGCILSSKLRNLK